MADIRHFDELTVAERIERLSDGQRECLQLVGLYHSSKEVARLLGISPHTVDQRLKRATSILGVASRAEAARLLMQHMPAIELPETGGKAYDELVYLTAALPSNAEIANLAPPYREPGRSIGSTEDALFDFQEQYLAGRNSWGSRPSIWSILVGDEHENKLSASARIVSIIGLAVLAIFGFALLVSIAEGLSRFG